MKIIGLLQLVLGIVAAILTVLRPDQIGWAGIFAAATAILSGAAFTAVGYRCTIQNLSRVANSNCNNNNYC